MADILLLETDRQLAGNTEEFFKLAGHRLHYFSDPQQAITAIDHSRPDLTIIDLFLASRSGIEFLFELRSYPEWEHLPVLVTGDLSVADIKDYRAALSELGVHDYLSKTASLKQLLDTVEHLLQPTTA
jgi:DNA-binding response OmpR family regulator